MKLTVIATIIALALTAANAFGAFNISQGASAPTYTDHNITFDEAGVPVGVNMNPYTFYTASDGITFGFDDGQPYVVDDWDALAGVAGGAADGNMLADGFGIRMVFDTPVTELSWQGWATGSGPPMGGMSVFVLNDESRLINPDNAAASYFGGPVPFGGANADFEWFNVVATDGDSFDEIRFFNGAFNSFNNYADNISYNLVPEPNTLVLCGLGVLAMVGVRRRR